MSLRIASNVGSLIAQHSLSRSSTAMGRSLERLSTGLKVNRGADGPAALVISEKQRAQIAGLEQAIENSEKAASVVQTAEGALNEINSLLIKIRSLALDSANSGVNDADAMAANQAEIDNALETINRIANSTQFSTKKLLNGDSGVTGATTDPNVAFLGGSATTQEGTYDLTVATEATRGNLSAFFAGPELTADETLTINDVQITLNAGLTQDGMISRINEFSDQTGVVAENDGFGGTRFYTSDFGTDASFTIVSNLAAADSGVSDTAATFTGTDIEVTVNDGTSDIGTYTGNGNELVIDSGAAKGLSLRFAVDPNDAVYSVFGAQGSVNVYNNSLTFQIGANMGQTASLAIDRVSSAFLGNNVQDSQYSSLQEISVATADNATASLEVIDSAIDQITAERGELGAFQHNTLEATTNNLRATLENSVNAQSVIRDTDFAQEIAEFTKQQVLVQAGTSLLGSANQASQLVLSLL